MRTGLPLARALYIIIIRTLLSTIFLELDHFLPSNRLFSLILTYQSSMKQAIIVSNMKIPPMSPPKIIGEFESAGSLVSD